MFSTKNIHLIFLVVLNDRNFNLFAKTCRITYIQFKPTPAYCICTYTWNEKGLTCFFQWTAEADMRDTCFICSRNSYDFEHHGKVIVFSGTDRESTANPRSVSISPLLSNLKSITVNDIFLYSL